MRTQCVQPPEPHSDECGYKKDSSSNHSQVRYKIIQFHTRLLEDAAQGARLNFPVHWHHTTLCAVRRVTAQDGMAATLSEEHKAEPFQRLDGFLAGNKRGFRPGRALQNWSEWAAKIPRRGTPPDKVP